MKLLTEGIILVISFFLLWLGLAQINWLQITNYTTYNKKIEKQIGNFYWDAYSTFNPEITTQKIVSTVDSITTKLCTANNINRSEIKLHIVQATEINAFALPDGHIVLNSALLKKVATSGELTGVIAHELAHYKKNHVTRKLINEIGIAAVLSMIDNGKHTQNVTSTLNTFISSAFSREMENEADQTAAIYMTNAKVNPNQLSNFLLSFEVDDNHNITQWISSHPSSIQRAANLSKHSLNTQYTPIISQQTWSTFKSNLQQK